LKNHFDVLIVGAGPAGLSAARSAAQEGASTLLVERKKEVGASIRCGEFIPSLAQIKKLMPYAISIESFYKLLSKDAVCNVTKKIRVFSPKNREYEFSFDGLVLRRNLFERNIAEEAEKTGVTIQAATTLEAVKNEGNITKVSLRNKNETTFVRTKLVIGADGFPSKTGEWTNLKVKAKFEDLALCVQQVASEAKLDDDTVELYFGKKCAPGGYAWIIPKGGGEANVGVGVRLSHLTEGHPAVDYLNAFVKKNPVSSPHFIGAEFQPLIGKTLFVGGLVSNVHGNRALLAGDAAGTLIAVNGSGIPTALVSGHLAGETASRHLKENYELSLYATALRREVGRIVERGYLYRRLGDVFARSDEVFENVLRMIGTNNVSRVIKCEPISPLFN